MKPDTLMIKKRQIKEDCLQPTYWLQFANLYWRTKEEAENALTQCRRSIRRGVGEPSIMKAKLTAIKTHLNNLKSKNNDR